MSNDNDGEKGRPDLDLDFTQDATDGLKTVDVSKAGSLDSRLEKNKKRQLKGL